MTLHATVRPGPNHTQILVTEDGDDCLRARLPIAPNHPRALSTLLEGLALWRSRPVRVVIVADGLSTPSSIDALLGDALYPPDCAAVRFEVHHPRVPRRLRGMGDFRDLYLVRGGGR